MSAPSLNVARAYSHPLRVRILQRFAILAEEMPHSPITSPTDLADDFDEPLGNVSYHVKKLLEFGMVQLVTTEPRRGAVEHFYALTAEAEAVTR